MFLFYHSFSTQATNQTELLKVVLSQPNPTPTQQQLNLTRLRLDSIITPNPPTHPTTTNFSLVESSYSPRSRLLIGRELSKPVVVTVVTAWRQHYISLM